MMLLLLPLLACAQPPAEAPKPAPAGPSVPTLLGEAHGVAYLGDWTSKDCTARTFARNIRFEDDGTYAAVDLVSPCPVGTQCAWSGIVAYQGIYQQQSETLELRDIGGTPAAGPHPTSFRADDAGHLVEGGCTYEKGLTVPEGYDAAKVTPAIIR